LELRSDLLQVQYLLKVTVQPKHAGMQNTDTYAIRQRKQADTCTIHG